MFIPKCTPRRVGGFAVSMPIYLPEIVKKRKMTKDGEVVKVTVEMVNQAKELPDSVTTDLSTLLAAGVSPEVIRQPMFGKNEVDYNQIIDNIKKEDNTQSNSKNQEQSNSKNQEQTNSNKGE